MKMSTMTLDELNRLPDGEARAALAMCCGSSRWADGLLDRRPFASFEQLLASAAEVEATLSDTDWHEAFAHHPRLGDLASLRQRFAATAEWANREQAGASEADEATLRALAEGNRAYEQCFGYTFILCATGKSADEMLAALRARLNNDPRTELSAAAFS